MKAKLNLTIDEDVLLAMKTYAGKRHTSLSDLVEKYFRSIQKPNKKNIISLVEKLDPPAIDATKDLKELFYKDQAKKYGF